MQPLLPGIFAAALYLLGAGLQLFRIRGKSGIRKAWVLFCGLSALLLHGGAVYLHGIDSGVLPMLSLIALCVAAIALAYSLRKPLENLLVVTLPVCALSMLPVLFTAGAGQSGMAAAPGILGHVVLSVAAYSLLTIAAIQATLLAYGDRILRRRSLHPPGLPSLETMELMLFEMLWLGLGLLSFSIVTGFLFVESFNRPGLIHHTVITLAAWVVFAVLLWGRQRLGWRGSAAAKWTLSGFALLATGYLGSKLVLAVIY